MQYSDFVRTGVKIDSIIDDRPYKYSIDADSIIYVGGSMFFLDFSGRCDAQSIWFDKISSVQLGKYVVNSSTTYTDLRKMFPMGCAETKPCNHVRFKGTILETCRVNVTDSKGQLWEMKIKFYLKDDKLIGVNFWEPD